MARAIKQFFRPSEKAWIDTTTGPIHGLILPYAGPEKRLPRPSAQKSHFFL